MKRACGCLHAAARAPSSDMSTSHMSSSSLDGWPASGTGGTRAGSVSRSSSRCGEELPEPPEELWVLDEPEPWAASCMRSAPQVVLRDSRGDRRAHAGVSGKNNGL